MKIERFDAAERLREYCEMLRPAAAARNPFLKCKGPASLPVEGDPLKLQRIVQNLLLNALKATRHGGVAVRWSGGKGTTAGQWVLSIGDAGPGSAALPSGEGIGLSIVKRLCEVLGATLELETAPGRGTTIGIAFPVRYSGTAPDPGSDPPDT